MQDLEIYRHPAICADIPGSRWRETGGHSGRPELITQEELPEEVNQTA
jgi:hypothetical protein